MTTPVWVTADETDERIDRVLTQYRESPNLLALERAYLNEAGAGAEKLAEIATAFDIDSSTGDQLTIIGKWLGWPREHCNGTYETFFGFSSDRTILQTQFFGFCETLDAEFDCAGTEAENLFGFDAPLGSTDGCPDAIPVGGLDGTGIWYKDGLQRFKPYTFADDTLYRKWLKARQITVNKDYSRPSLISAAQQLFGNNVVLGPEQPGEIVVILTRAFTDAEKSILHLATQALPVAPGVQLRWGEADGGPVGFGDGWGELCTGGFYRLVRDPFERFIQDGNFGFGSQQAGLCEGFIGA